MRKMKKLICLLILIIFVTGIAIAGCTKKQAEQENPGQLQPQPQTEHVLKAMKGATPPKIDGEVDELWGNITPLNIKLTEGKNLNGGTTDLTMKAMYTDTDIYFLVQWKDPTQSLEPTPWTYDGTKWTRTSAEQSFEDSLIMVWNMNNSITNFNERGWEVIAHKTQDNRWALYTNGANEKGDLWQWRAARTDPMGYLDDMYLDNTPYDPNKTPDAGKKGDEGKAAYIVNENQAKTGPLYKWKSPPADPRFLMVDDAVEITNLSDFEAGEKIPGYVLQKPSGSRADIVGKAKWKDGMWTLEFSRKLKTERTDDIQFDPNTNNYYFVVGVLDNTETQQAGHTGVYQINFLKQ